MVKEAMTQEQIESKERDLVRTNLELFIKDFCGKLEHPKGLVDLFPWQELAAQITIRYDVSFKEAATPKKPAAPVA